MADVVVSWAALRSFMRERCGVQLAEEQSYLMEARLGDVARRLRYRSVDEYVLDAVRPGAARAVITPLIDAMTTHETSFFRDPGFWKSTVDLVLPRVASAGRTALRIWCGACSTGQEPYSLAMTLHERFPHLAEHTTIFATDVSEGVLERGRAGRFTPFEISRGLSPHRLAKYFERDGVNVRARESLRKVIRWSTQNLLTDAPPALGLDLALIRNVLIYFDEPTRHQILGRVRASLRPGGLFAVGTSELIGAHWGIPVAPGWYPAAL